ncbi:MAG: hypothetical protein PHP03_02985 [Candidatus Pacebacteria bacterium]|nr:hypothetical protein [Candidatus Paceibacterota bacterium]
MGYGIPKIRTQVNTNQIIFGPFKKPLLFKKEVEKYYFPINKEKCLGMESLLLAEKLNTLGSVKSAIVCKNKLIVVAADLRFMNEIEYFVCDIIWGYIEAKLAAETMIYDSHQQKKFKDYCKERGMKIPSQPNKNSPIDYAFGATIWLSKKFPEEKKAKLRKEISIAIEKALGRSKFGGDIIFEEK